jgi:hypothetical protein
VQSGVKALLQLQSFQCIALLQVKHDFSWHSLLNVRLSPVLSHGILLPHIEAAIQGAGHGCARAEKAQFEARPVAELAPQSFSHSQTSPA